MARKSIPAINESELETDQPVFSLRDWIKDHLIVIYFGAAILLIIAIFVGISAYQNANHPIAKFMSASSKNFNSSFRFDLEMIENGNTQMRYKGTYSANPSKQNVKALYDADYGSYSYMGAVYSEGETRVNGNLYNGKWRLRDCTEKVLNFFDFNTKYKAGHFDGASFLRFTDLTSRYSADELNTFMKLIKSRMAGDSDLATAKITSSGDSKTYTFEINLREFFDLVRDKGASVFFSSLDYDAFCSMYKQNESTVRQADCIFTYTINNAGWMTEMSLSVTVGDEEYTVKCTMDDFGEAAVNFPSTFMDALEAE